MSKSLIRPVTDDQWDANPKDPELFGRVLIAFLIPGFKPCDDLLSVLEKVAKSNPELPVLSYNINQENLLKVRVGLEGVPTLVLFDGQMARWHLEGHQSLYSVQKMLDSCKSLPV